MGKWVHRLSEVSDTGSATCAECGPVQCVWHKRWQCPTSRKADWAGKPRSKSKEGLQEARDRRRSVYFERCGGTCDLCSKPIILRTARLDHDHEICPQSQHCCDKCFRGVLCAKCNTGLGALGDSEEGLLRALEYLRK